MTSSNNTKSTPVQSQDGVVLQGYHKKLKTMKKKYFVLCAESGASAARLEYYDSEKKFRSRSNPKRTIILKTCFNINRRLDTKHKFVIALSTKEEGFCIVLESEDELNKWLKTLLSLQRGEDTESEPPKPTFEHVWQVQVQRKGLAEEKGIIGSYHVCLTSKSLTLVRIGSPTTSLGEARLYSVEFYLTTIRRCGDSQCYFYMEVGRHSAIGAGELWMETEDTLIAQNMHRMILNEMSSKIREDTFGPMRKRSSSANEASKPISVLQRRQTHSGNKPMNSSPLNESPSATSSAVSSASTIVQAPITKPTTSKILEKSQTHGATNNSNSTTTGQPNDVNNHRPALSASSCCSSTRATPVITNTSCNPQYPFTAPIRSLGSQRRHSVSAITSIFHQRTLSLPSGDPLITMNNSNFVESICGNSSKCSNNTVNNINAVNTNNNCNSKIIAQSMQPIHQRTRSLPLTEETAIRNNKLNSQSSLKQICIISSNVVCSCNIPAKMIHNCSPNTCCKGSHSCSLFALPTSNNHCNNNSTLNTKKKNNNNINVSEHIELNNNGSSYIAANSMESITEDTNSPKFCSDIKNIQNFILKNINGKQSKMSASSHGKTTTCSGSPSLLRRGRNCLTARSTILGRDRSDSLPSRNRTASECSNQSIMNSMMPPPRTIPSLSNRPHSMYNNRHSHSHSPPMNALSPSTGCSESDGSSLSIDETDSFGHSLTPDESGNFVTRYYNSRTSGTVIPEENCDDFWYTDNKKTALSMDKLNNHPTVLSLPITNQNLNRKGSPGSQAGSTVVQGQYMDMHSPYSPCSSSPCDQTGSGYIPNSPGVEIPRGLYAGSSGGHSRASSLAEETVDGYVPMGPPQPQDYVDMEQSSKHQSGLSSAASSCSITSGTPSTDIRFAEYPLDKVKSRFTPEDEDIQSAIDRPMRAYSVGSRLEHNKRKLRVDVLNAEQNNSRVRAFSVGSRAKVPRSDLYRGAFLSNLPSCQGNNNNIEISSSGKGKKSSSAPILVHKSQSSVDRMDDLMEIDYSKNSEQSSTPSPIRFSSFPVAVPARPVYDPHSSSSPKTVSFPGYVEMKPGSPAEKSTSLSSIKASETGYLEMKPVGLSKSPSLSSSPIKAISSPKSTCQHYGSNGGISGSDYMNISPSTKSTSSMSRGISSSTDEFSSDKIMEVDHFPVISSTPEGYMDMSFGKSKKQETRSEMRMPMESKTWENRSVSMPIDIKTKDKGFSSLSLSEAFSKKRYRSDSKENDPTTPSGSQAPIFPFSPCSPIKTFVQNDFAQRKCLVDATSGTVTISEEDNSVKEFTIAEVDEMEITPEKYKILNTDNFKVDTTQKVDALTSDYADMSLSSSKRKENEKLGITEASDYVNYVPPTEQTVKITEKGNQIKNSIISPNTDYAVMNANPKSMVGTVITSSANSVFNNRKCVPIALGNYSKVKPNSFEGFKPISAGNDDLLHSTDIFTKKVSSKPTFSQLNRNLSDKNKKDDHSGYELLQMRSDSSLQMKKLSRPNSVNSEKIYPLKASGRPNSANSDCILSISTSSSTSTLCGGSSSSSSTLCGSKSQSPLATSRPQSFSDSTVASRPESIGSLEQGISSRPPSVSSERELHYASLDLPPSTTPSIVESNCQNSCGPAVKGHSSASGDSSTSPSPNAGACQQQPTFTYAQIDFNKSESLKLALNATSNNS